MNQHRVILWDLENTLYPYSSAFGPAVQLAMVKTINDLRLGLTPAQAWAMAQPTYPLQTIVKLEKITCQSRHDLFLRFHDNLSADFISPDSLLAHELVRCRAKHVLITHSSRKFATRALAQLGVSHCFPEHLRITAEDLKGIGKGDSAAPILLALSRAQVSAHEAVLVDDRDENLRHAKALGLATVLVGNRGEELEAQHCDVFFPTAGSFLRHYNAGLLPALLPDNKLSPAHAYKP